jgi:uncharacterized protein (UPF0332 family)
MTDEAQQQAIQQAIQMRLSQAHETLQESATLLKHQLWRGTINRAYYAMFYAVLALAALRQVSVSKHTHAISFFDKEFIKTAIFSKEFSRSLHYAFDERQAGDYGGLSEIDAGEAQTAYEEAKSLVEAVSEYLTPML